MRDKRSKLIVASALVETLAEKVKPRAHVEKKLMGESWSARRYVPPFDYYYKARGTRSAS